MKSVSSDKPDRDLVKKLTVDHDGDNDTSNAPCLHVSQHPVILKMREEAMERESRKLPYTTRSSFDASIKTFRDLGYSFMAVPIASEMFPMMGKATFSDLDEKRNKILNSLESCREPEDLFYTWKVITCISTEKGFDWENERIQEFCDAFVRILPELSTDQVITSVQHLSFILRYPMPTPNSIRTVKLALNKECASRFRLDCKNCRARKSQAMLTEEARAKYLQCAFFWLKVDQVTKATTFERSGMYLRTLVEEFLLGPDYLSRLTPSEFVFTLFLSGEIRQLVDIDRFGRGIPEPLSDKLTEIWPSLTIREIGIVAHSLYKTKLKLVSSNMALTDLFLHSLLEAEDKETLVNDISISAVCKLLKSTGSLKPRLLSKILKKYEPLVQYLPPMATIRIINIINQDCPADYPSFLNTYVKYITAGMPDLRIKDLELVAFTLFFLSYRESAEVYHKLFKSLETVSMQDPRSGRSFVFINYFLAQMGLFQHSNLDRMFTLANKMLSGNEDYDFSDREGVKRACNDYAFSLCKPEDYQMSASEKQVTRWVVQSSEIYEQMLPILAEIDAEFELKGDPQNYHGTRLDPDLRKIFLASRNHRVVANKRTYFEKIIPAMFRDISNILEHVSLQYLYPQATSKDIIFCLDTSSDETKEGLKTLPIPESFTRSLVSRSSMIRPPDVSDGRWIAIFVGKRNHFDSDRCPLGPINCRVHALTNLGYQAIIFDPVPYQAPLRKRQGQRYIKRLLQNSLLA